MANYDDLNNRQIFTVAIISAVLTFITILACQVVYYALAERIAEQKLQEAQFFQGNSILTRQSDAISQYGVNEETGQVQIPVEMVMTRLADQHSSKKDNEKDNEKPQSDPSET